MLIKENRIYVAVTTLTDSTTTYPLLHFYKRTEKINYIAKSLENSTSLSLSRHTFNLISYMLFTMHILVTVSAELFVVAFESSE
jgi:hypothetical protein